MLTDKKGDILHKEELWVDLLIEFEAIQMNLISRYEKFKTSAFESLILFPSKTTNFRKKDQFAAEIH